jgi:hypothetical protein
MLHLPNVTGGPACWSKALKSGKILDSRTYMLYFALNQFRHFIFVVAYLENAVSHS